MSESLSLVNQESTQITMSDVLKYLCPNATEKEAMMFVQLCRTQNLNPWRKEAYLIKYTGSPATTVVGKDLFTRRAQSNPRFKGFKAGVILQRGENIIESEGAFSLPTDKLLGGWAQVHVKDCDTLFKSSVALSEYNKNQAMWKSIPATMIRKVALVQALREAFPEDLGGLYDSSEMNVSIDTPIDTAKVEIVKPELPEPVLTNEQRINNAIYFYAREDLISQEEGEIIKNNEMPIMEKISILQSAKGKDNAREILSPLFQKFEVAA